MQIFINSEFKEIPDNVNTVGKLIRHLNIPQQGTGIGLNNHIVIARNWDSTPIKQEDRIIIISATYGG